MKQVIRLIPVFLLAGSICLDRVAHAQCLTVYTTAQGAPVPAAPGLSDMQFRVEGPYEDAYFASGPGNTCSDVENFGAAAQLWIAANLSAPNSVCLGSSNVPQFLGATIFNNALSILSQSGNAANDKRAEVQMIGGAAPYNNQYYFLYYESFLQAMTADIIWQTSGQQCGPLLYKNYPTNHPDNVTAYQCESPTFAPRVAFQSNPMNGTAPAPYGGQAQAYEFWACCLEYCPGKNAKLKSSQVPVGCATIGLGPAVPAGAGCPVG